MGRPVYGAIVRVFDADGAQVLEGSTPVDSHYGYYDGDAFPSGSQPHTHADGLFYVGNLTPPVDGRRFRIEAWGVHGYRLGSRLRLIGAG